MPGSTTSRKGERMKKFILLSTIGVFFVSTLIAGTWTAVNTTCPMKVVVDSTKTIYKRTLTAVDTANGLLAADSINGADTIWIFKGVHIDPTAFYAIGLVDSIGAADSLRLSYQLYDRDGNQMSGTTLDTITPTTATSKAYTTRGLNINKTQKGITADFSIVGWLSSKVALIWRAYLIREIPVSSNEPQFTR